MTRIVLTDREGGEAVEDLIGIDRIKDLGKSAK